MSNNQSLQENVKAFVKKVLTDIKVNRDDEEARIQSIREALLLITQEFITETLLTKFPQIIIGD